MIKKSMIFIALFLFIILTAGCETTVGAVKGVACGVSSTAEGVAEGTKKDTINLIKFIKATDNWIKENLW